MNKLGALKRAVYLGRRLYGLAAACVLRNCFRAFAYSVFCKFSGQQKTDGRLNLSTGDRRTLVVMSQTRGLAGDPSKYIVDEAVHDRHGFAGNACIWVNLLQHFVHVDGITLPPPPLPLLIL